MSVETSYLDELNVAQREATLYNDGPSLIIAGAGSGKTRVLTYKIAYLLQQGVPPDRILALTFTNKAAREMRERIAAVVGEKTTNRLWMGTFHSVFYRILRSEAEQLGFTPQFTIYDTADSKSLIKNIVKELGLDDKMYKPSFLSGRISSLKNRLITPNAYQFETEAIRTDFFQKIPQFKEVYERYAARCKASNAMDFDDLLLYTNILFRDYPETLRRYQEHFSFLLIDEYQDTNFAQHLIVSKLVEKHQHVCAVGDDAQSIYSFRGANIDNILSFQRNYPLCKLFKLEQNYRSTQTIVEAANSLIHKNENQIRKHIFSKNEKGNLLEIVSSYSDFDEAFAITNKIVKILKEEHSLYSDFAVLYRTNAQSRVLEEALRKKNLPYKIYGGLSFYQRKEIKDLLAYFRLTLNKNDEEALRRIINYPARGIGDTTFSKVLSCAHLQEVCSFDVVKNPLSYHLKINSGTADKLSIFAEMIVSFTDFCQQNDAYAVAEHIVRNSGILSDISSDNSLESQTKKENVEELLSAIHEFCDRKANEGVTDISLMAFLSEVSLLTDQDTEKEEDRNRITLMTIHAAKGLEFKNVFVAGLEEQLFPSAMCQSERELEEERRLFYVAITRAKENCVITYAKSRFRNGQTQFSTPSRFLKDIDTRFLFYPAETSTFYGKKTFEDTSVEKLIFKEIKPAVSPNFKKVAEVISSDQRIIYYHNLEIGKRIIHATFGEGVVVALDGEGDNSKAKIDFKTGGTKQLLLKYAKLTIME